VTFAFAAGLALGIAFLAAGAAKVASGPLWAQQAEAIGAPRVAVAVVPPLEIVLGALLCTRVAPAVVAVMALALLAMFTTLIMVRLAQGKRPPCACFGSWSARPLGWRHLLRNGVLMALAVVVLIG